MKKFPVFISLLFIVLLTFIFFPPESTLADGMMIKIDPYSDRWDYSGEANQQAFIHYADGVQKMIISVGLEEENNSGVVWLFPIPAEPNKITIDIINNLPHLSGEEVSGKANHNIDGISTFLQTTQVYAIPFILLSHVLSGNIGSKGFDNSLGEPRIFGGGINSASDTVVHEHLEKEGVTSEVITAKTADGLYNYLKSQNLKIEKGSISVLNYYIGKEYSFIASWIDNSQATFPTEKIVDILYQVNRFHDQTSFPRVFELMNNLQREYPDFHPLTIDYQNDQPEYLQSERGEIIQQEIIQFAKYDRLLATEMNKMSQIRYKMNGDYIYADQKGVSITFPTKNMYFPLLPTSVYESKIVPATIRVIGHVSPIIFKDIVGYTKTGYYIDSLISSPEDVKNFYGEDNQDIKYTKIEINAPSKFLTDDLWIRNQAPIRTYYSTFIAKQPVMSTIFLLIVSSVMAGILAGLMVFKDLRNNPLKLGFIGLSNALTLLGLFITTVLVNTKNRSNHADSRLIELYRKGYLWKRRLATVLFAIAMPFLLVGMIALPSFINEFSYHSDMEFFHTGDMIAILILYILPISILLAGFAIKKIKSEDEKLFDELKSAGYSSWSFHPKDKMKYIFVPTFSVFFLTISWLLTHLIRLTV